MDETVIEYIRRTVLKIPRKEIKIMLQKWGFLSRSQLQTINFQQTKENISRRVALLCQENSADIKEAAALDIIYNHVYPNKRLWSVYQMNKTIYQMKEKETEFFDIRDFKTKFKRKLHSALENVTINFREYDDSAIWIRIAWGTPYRKPNQYKTSYVVYHSQTPYAFVSVSMFRSNVPLLLEALVAASNYNHICAMELRSHSLNSLKEIVFNRYSQNFQTYYPEALQEHSVEPESEPQIVHENRKTKEKIQGMNQQAFWDCSLPKLEYAQYKLETMFESDPKMGVLHRKQPFRCLVKFSSPDLFESLKSLAATSMAETSLSPLLTCIPQKPMNNFRITEKHHLFPGDFLRPYV
ncbi:LOW QUALITY PROTEIN: centromere protein N [Strigops habroptila]|uniref:LOW QUALITY PROTEIN: centromere protein N n=1 Tax=Strigops habroptila TaxID=2489341 RepID=UPI0011CF1EED|nr:LOW QUALITY PROTEIN: centromere protein N [Strigops habroptila]